MEDLARQTQRIDDAFGLIELQHRSTTKDLDELWIALNNREADLRRQVLGLQVSFALLVAFIVIAAIVS